MSAVAIGQQLERVNSKGPRATIGDMGKIANALDCPLWVLMIPGLSDHPELLDGPGLQRLVRLMERYIECDDSKRFDVEVVAQAGAIVATIGR